MANCANCGKRITLLNSVDLWNFNDKTLCDKCTGNFDSLLLRKSLGWKSYKITRDFIDENASFLKMKPTGIEFLHEYADYIQNQITPEELERLKAEEKEAEIRKLEDQKREEERKRLLQQQEAEEQRLREEQERERVRAMAGMLISSGFNFEGYRIVKYSGYISGDDAVQIPRSGVFDRGRNGQNLTEALVRIRRVALQELKQAAYDLGCNAVIGVDFDYLTLDPQTATITGGTLYEPYVICVTANGNAVVIEKIED